jgi:hypothetical protein
MTALNERLQAKGTKSRPGMDGWVEKKGRFRIGVTTKVIRFFPRTTYLSGQAERQSGYTLITGNVAAGASWRTMLLVFVGILIAAGILISSGNTLIGTVLIPAAFFFSIPMIGDDQNSEYLIGELQKTLKAKFGVPNTASAKSKGSKTARRA